MCLQYLRESTIWNYLIFQFETGRVDSGKSLLAPWWLSQCFSKRSGRKYQEFMGMKGVLMVHPEHSGRDDKHTFCPRKYTRFSFYIYLLRLFKSSKVNSQRDINLEWKLYVMVPSRHITVCVQILIVPEFGKGGIWFLQGNIFGFRHDVNIEWITRRTVIFINKWIRLEDYRKTLAAYGLT